MSNRVLLGAVAYDSKVVTIWDGFRQWFRDRDLDFDYVLYSHYERQIEDLVEGHIDVAWHSPLAWVRTVRLARARSVGVRAVVMRDSDRDLVSAVLVRADSDLASLDDLRGRSVATGAIDSPQAHLLPLSMLREAGLRPDVDFKVSRFDVRVGLHGDHVGGERDAAVALRSGLVDAACMLDANTLLFSREGTLPAGSVRVLAKTEPFDHCTMAVGPGADKSTVDRFTALLLGMAYDDPTVRPLFDLEGLKQWLPARTDRYSALERAVDELGFLDAEGKLCADDYRP
ncbi:conserved hypothetical protein [Catenulispora acidiphila DSM 44928]|uniref:ABC-type phosphate/phosphonate transport system periplasmic component-like protein n=1 Tax=Catenulispora acidiphila (strain DSM 44928 / JCM 14897 / NBRC 102108 / NRRL B-24433 / ID139908) TaxID=479433 RepID=C7PXD8_CATAD|nr:phosphate/phosphite/phosphonate ABC transporter substrate-binding protein [Catenulispora acidiphila]ACU69489.1 conserved hypothetical protein [Catenulispora acidiphila DSM 44928]